MEVGINLSLSTPLRFPVRIRVMDGVPKILASGIPVTSLNLILVQRQREKGSTPASLATYARAARLYVEFCAHRHRSLIQISNIVISPCSWSCAIQASDAVRSCRELPGKQFITECSSAFSLEAHQLPEPFTAPFKKEHSDPGHAEAN
ncbi:MAG: hypothetical protein ACJ8DI_30785 [Ktedonobacteraceae bacterium]